jgi:LEA14-like dessication related protein
MIMKIMKKSSALPVMLSCFLLLGGCAALFLQTPSVTVAGIDVVDAGLFEQRFAFKLRVQNPNDTKIVITGLSFALEINGKPFAKGVSNKGLTIDRLSEGVLEVTAVSNLYGLLTQIKELIDGKNKGLSYRIKGRLLTEAYGDLNFDESGKLEPPQPDTGREKRTGIGVPLAAG